MGRPGLPMSMSILITGRCNLDCAHCSVTSHGALPGELGLEGWRTVLDRLEQARVLQLTITGGEPLARPDFAELWAELSARPFRLYLNSNGTLIDGSAARLLAGTGKRFDSVMIGLDGPSSDAHDALRGRGAFDAMMKGVSSLAGEGVPFGFYCTVSRLNADLLDETAELALSLGALWIRLNYLTLAGPAIDSSLSLPVEMRRPAGRKALELAGRFPGRVSGTAVQMEALARRLEKGLRAEAGSCGAGSTRLSVLPDGQAIPCDHIPHFTLGSLLERSLREIVDGRRASEFREMLHGRAWLSDEMRQRCSSCPYIDACSPGCPVQAFGLDDAGGPSGTPEECVAVYMSEGRGI